jgi:TPR repeat protein
MMSTCSALSTFGRLRIASFVAALVVSSTSVYAGALDDARASLAKQDFASAAAKFQEAVDQGDPEALAIMGTMYYEGIGVPYDEEKAFQLNMKAAEQGRVDAQFHLAEAYAQRSTKTPDRELREEEIGEARRWFTAASAGAKPKAEAGDPLGQWILGEFYTVAWGGFPRDFVKSVAWLTKAAEQNVVSAQFKLGMAYESGQGVQSDPLKAREWYMKAAQAGHSGAQLRLGRSLELSGDKEGAKIWYTQAALLGDSTASGFLRNHYNIHIGDPTAFDQQQADLRAKDAVHQTNSLINFGGVALGNAVISLMGTGNNSADPRALQDYREQIQRNTNNLTDQVIKNMQQQDRINTKAMQ